MPTLTTLESLVKEKYNNNSNQSYIDLINKAITDSSLKTNYFDIEFNGEPNKNKNSINSVNFEKFWQQDNINTIFEIDNISVPQFVALLCIIYNETGGSFLPLKERGSLFYMFNEEKGKKQSYNTSPYQKSCFKLFSDAIYKKYHSDKYFADKLQDTTDTRWDGVTFPVGFSGEGEKKEKKQIINNKNTFVSNADFNKFRGRGYIQVTFRSNYKPIIEEILKYSGDDSIVLKYKNEFNTIYDNENKNIDSLLTAINSSDLDELMSNKKTATYLNYVAIKLHNKNGGNYLQRVGNATTVNELEKALKYMGLKISGIQKYATLFTNRCFQILNFLI